MKFQNKIIADTSVWIDFFRSRHNEYVEILIEQLKHKNILMCGMIELEIRQGLRVHERAITDDFLKTIEFIDSTREDYQIAGDLISEMKSRGITESAQDSLIAAVCINNNIQLLTTDLDFHHFPKLKIVEIKK